ncbi:TetR/AcrR family transcriptional regulator [Nocardioides sp. AE5]|uniref:TetR/AcrR family transcriptional regulator n=1 Tax=Nocardioides sp. AE5 TaxID=2962573 RepID=UPI002880E678|nr:TetR/AcrR family transcriptional regulator [Nocardioides sp. AE5]MDT0202307.1 TetR/AcrR family transcriptional regulator [Nocardioides sp. AE5]
MTTGARRYGGASAEERVAERRTKLLEAGLELMGTRGLAGTTVRGVAEEAGLAARYFYESFPTVEQLQIAVFDQIAEESLHRALGALADAGNDKVARTRAVLTEMVDLMLTDARKGRVVLLESLASPVLGARAMAESRRFAHLLAATAASGDPAADSTQVPARVRIVAQFLIGGVAHTLGAVLQGEVEAERDEIVAALVELFLTVDAGTLHRESRLPG